MNDVCLMCDFDRPICSCTRRSPVPPRQRLFATLPVHYWRDQYDPRDFKEMRR